jgi:hypothetical protein
LNFDQQRRQFEFFDLREQYRQLRDGDPTTAAAQEHDGSPSKNFVIVTDGVRRVKQSWWWS